MSVREWDGISHVVSMAFFFVSRREQNASMFLFLELKLSISFAVFAVLLYSLLLTVLFIS